MEKKRGRLCSWRPLHYQFRYDAVFVIAETTLGLSSGIPPYVLLFAYLLSFLSFMLFSLSLSFSALLLQPGSLFVPAWLCNAYLPPSLTNQAPSHPFASFLFSWNVSTVDHFADLHLLNFSCRPLISFHERTRIHILPFPCKNLPPTLPYPSHLLSTLASFHFTNLHLKDIYTLSSTGLKNKFFQAYFLKDFSKARTNGTFVRFDSIGRKYVSRGVLLVDYRLQWRAVLGTILENLVIVVGRENHETKVV